MVVIRKLSDIENTQKDVKWGNGSSRRLLLAIDNMGYSVTDTIVEPNTESLLEYKNHLETCYCIEGEGEIEILNGPTYPLIPGVLYALDKHEAHFLRAKTRLRLICIFNPPLQGNEKHYISKHTTSSY